MLTTILLIALIVLATLAVLAGIAYACDAWGLLGWLCFGHLFGQVLEASWSLILALVKQD
jgi:hypothetical protein